MTRITGNILVKICIEVCLTVHLPHEINWNANLMQLSNFIDVFLARRVSGTYAHHRRIRCWVAAYGFLHRVFGWIIATAETWLGGQPSDFLWVACKIQSNGLKSLLSFLWSMLNKSRVWSLFSFQVGLRTYQHPGNIDTWETAMIMESIVSEALQA